MNKFSSLKEGLPILKTACAPCMLGTPPKRHTRTSTIVMESVGRILFC